MNLGTVKDRIGSGHEYLIEWANQDNKQTCSIQHLVSLIRHMSPWVEWGQKVISSLNNPIYGLKPCNRNNPRDRLVARFDTITYQ